MAEWAWLRHAQDPGGPHADPDGVPRRISEARAAGGPGVGPGGVRDVRKTILPLLAVVFVLGPQTGASESELSGSLQLVKDVRPGPIGSSIADVVQIDGDL